MLFSTFHWSHRVACILRIFDRTVRLIFNWYWSTNDPTHRDNIRSLPDEGLPTPEDSIMWTDPFLGTKRGKVQRGPFANWRASHPLSFMPGMQDLYRDVGVSPFGGLYKEKDVDWVMQQDKYEKLTSCVDPTFELVHGLGHMFVGGYMADSESVVANTMRTVSKHTTVTHALVIHPCNAKACLYFVARQKEVETPSVP